MLRGVDVACDVQHGAASSQISVRTVACLARVAHVCRCRDVADCSLACLNDLYMHRYLGMCALDSLISAEERCPFVVLQDV